VATTERTMLLPLLKFNMLQEENPVSHFGEIRKMNRKRINLLKRKIKKKKKKKKKLLMDLNKDNIMVFRKLLC